MCHLDALYQRTAAQKIVDVKIQLIKLNWKSNLTNKQFQIWTKSFI